MQAIDSFRLDLKQGRYIFQLFVLSTQSFVAHHMVNPFYCNMRKTSMFSAVLFLLALHQIGRAHV